MKRILIILTFSLLTSSNLFAAEFSNQNKFNKWCLENGHSQYLKNGGAAIDICATFKKNSDDFIISEQLVCLAIAQIYENKELSQVFNELFIHEDSEIYLKHNTK